jgi:hypothetical protein
MSRVISLRNGIVDDTKHFPGCYLAGYMRGKRKRTGKEIAPKVKVIKEHRQHSNR